jgi:hypothetical protein
MPTIPHFSIEQADDEIHIWIDVSQTLIDLDRIPKDLWLCGLV